jgi:TolB-like protein
MALLLFGVGLPCFAQDALPFNDALKDVLSYLTGRMSSGSTVAVLGFQSDYPNLSEYILDDITAGLVDTDLYTVVDRRSLELLAQEMAFQLSGEVSDETALAIGRRLGAQMVISGAVSYLGEFYRLRVQAIEVETARIQGSRTVTIQPNRLLATLTGNPWTGPAVPDAARPEDVTPAAVGPPKTAAAPARPKRTPALASNTKRFYLGLRGGFSTNFYQPNTEFWGDVDSDAVSLSWDVSAQMSLQFSNFFALQAEAAFITGDTLEIKATDNDPFTLNYSAMALPILGKITLRPGSFLLAGFGGIYFTVPFTAMTFDLNGIEYSYKFDAPMGFIAGGNIGIKLGPGTLFLDIRYAGDFKDIEIYGDWGSHPVYKRSLASYSLGYEFGFGGGKGK